MAQVPEYWLVDVNAQTVVIHTDPEGNEYRMLEVVPRTGVLAPIALPGVTMVVDELFRDDDD